MCVYIYMHDSRAWTPNNEFIQSFCNFAMLCFSNILLYLETISIGHESGLTTAPDAHPPGQVIRTKGRIPKCKHCLANIHNIHIYICKICKHTCVY